MRKCPQCGYVGAFTLYGPIIYGTMTVEFEEDTDLVSNTGPCLTSTIVKRGKELDAKGAVLTCQRCKFSGSKSLFPLTMRCQWTGAQINDEDSVIIGGIRVSKSVEEEVRKVLGSPSCVDQSHVFREFFMSIEDYECMNNALV